MAARSAGIFPREGFNLDAATEIGSAGGTLPTNLFHAKTVRIICLGSTADSAVVVGGETVQLHSADADINGVVIAHIRGALLADQPAGTVVTMSGTGITNTKVYFELVDGARR